MNAHPRSLSRFGNLASLSLSSSLLLAPLLLLSSCSKSEPDGLASADNSTGYGMEGFPYDAAGNYIGSSGSSGDSVPVPNYGGNSGTSIASTPTPSPRPAPAPAPNYGDEAGTVTVVSNSSSGTDFSTPTPPSSSGSSSSSSSSTASTPSYTPPAPAPPSSSRKDYNRYRVQRGDTLSSIARAYGTSVSAIRRANNMSGSNIIAGRTINVPGKAPARTASASSGKTHKVQHKQTLYSIARRYGVSVSELQAANGLSGTMIRQGQTLRIP